MANTVDVQRTLIEAIKAGDLATFRDTLKEYDDICVDGFVVNFRVDDFLDRFQLERGNPFQIETLLHLAAYELQPDIASFLLKEKRASINVRNQGKTPLHLAVCTHLAASSTSLAHKKESPKLKMVKLLVENGADVRALDNDGQTALHLVFATMSGSLDETEELIRYLVKQGCSLSRKDREGYSPFHLACSDAPAGIAKLMLDLGASPTKPDNDGWTPLQMAACNPNSTQVLELLLNAGASARVQSRDKNTPAHFSKTVAHAKILFELGNADLTVRNKFGETPAQMAAGRKRHDVAQYLKLAQDYVTKQDQCAQVLFGIANSTITTTDDKTTITTTELDNSIHRNSEDQEDNSCKGEDTSDISETVETSNEKKNESNPTFDDYSFGLLAPVMHTVVNEGSKADLVAGYVCLREAISRLA